ncbi:MAG: hypothetical protein IGR92_03635 [Leptolyngbyaceae cyanobacterium T60_A2020_046]|nr:hypothetical protein [Leptolyngbyaceae cyanobacterium T60_A2020_046]
MPRCPRNRCTIPDEELIRDRGGSFVEKCSVLPTELMGQTETPPAWGVVYAGGLAAAIAPTLTDMMYPWPRFRSPDWADKIQFMRGLNPKWVQSAQHSF